MIDIVIMHVKYTYYLFTMTQATTENSTRVTKQIYENPEKHTEKK